MWVDVRLSTIGSFSIRGIATFLMAAMLSAFAWVVVMTTDVFAVNAEWNNGNLTYEGQIYAPESATLPSVPQGATVFSYKQPDQNIAHVIYFAPGVEAKSATSAQLQDFTFTTPPDTYTNPQTVRQVTVTPNQTADRNYTSTGQFDGGDNNNQGEATACAIKGIGWIICPVSRWLASGMDFVFNFLTDFLEYKTITFDTNNAMYRMWDIVRGLSNIAFVVAFLVIIYSQITNMGLGSYGIKKMLPRLIIGAILMNISYYLCAALVDLSNILGYNVQQMFIDLRGQIVGPNTQSNAEVWTWEGMSNFIISGGTLATAGGIGLAALVGTGVGVAGMAFMLVPTLVGVLVAVVVAILVMAARQALITILIIISPLAFVAYLLPNTEKWFDKWKDVFSTMLLLFPIFSALFGGAQLAGAIIIQTATDLNMVLLGMFVQVAPIVITPLLIKFSGGLLGRLAGIVNNPGKGVIDRTRNWSNEKVDKHKARRLDQASEDRDKGIYRRRQFMRNYALSRQRTKHKDSNDLKSYKAGFENSAEAHYKQRLEHMDDNGIVQGERAGLYTRYDNRNARRAYSHAYSSEMRLQAVNAANEADRENAKAGESTGVYARNNQEIKQSTQDISLQNKAAQSAKYVVNRQISDALERGPQAEALQRIAAGIDTQGGEARAVASAITTRVNDRAEGLKNLELMLDVNNLTSTELLKLAVGQTEVKGIENNPEIREVAIKKIASGPDIGSLHKLAAVMDLSDTSNEYWRTAFVDGLKANSKKPAEFSAGLLDKLSQGVQGGFGVGGLNDAFVSAVKANAFGSKGIVDADKDTLEHLASLLEHRPDLFDDESRDKLERAVFGVVKNANLSGALDKRKDAFERIANSVGAQLPDEF